MIALNPNLFARAAKKAAIVQPTVRHSGSRYFVRRADGRTATVKFTARNGQLWASCDCPAGNPQNRATPLPCYHVAAALMSANARRQHSHCCPRCTSLYPCACTNPEIDDLICDNCDAVTGDPFADHPDHHFWH